MELKHRLARQVIDIAVSKAMEDMKTNAKRSVRNLIDLGMFFSTTQTQKDFFTIARKVIASPRNPYHSLVARMIADVDNDTIKKIGLNLGYSSLIYGATKLKKRQGEGGIPVPWLLVFDVFETSLDFLHQMERFIGESRALGIYSYIARPRKRDDIFAICETARRFDECLFILETPSALIGEKTAESLGKIHNAMVSVRMTRVDFCRESDVDAFRLLKQNRCLFGFQVNYNEDTIKEVSRPEYIRSAIGLGSLFGVYVAEDGVSDACKDAAYAFACRERGEHGQPLIALEWSRDMRYVSERILSGDGCMAIELAEKVYRECINVKDVFAQSLPEILRSIQPCISL